jgi:hypothetical protein
MNVIDHRPGGWYLVEDGERLLFDVNCSYSGFGFSRVVELSAEERASYAARGSSYLDELADRVQYHAMDLFAIRHLGSEVDAAVTAAVEAWRASGGEKNASRPRNAV